MSIDTLGNGILALVGSGEYLPPIEPLDRYLLSRLNGNAKVVCLPTAAGTEGEERIKYWSDLGINHFHALGAQVEAVEVIDRETAASPDYARQILSANFIYLSGGKPAYLHDTLENSVVWQAILSVLQRGGVVAGCSAGAMIWGEIIPGFPVPWPWRTGFAYLPNTAIVPHFDEISNSFGRLVRGLLPKTTRLIGVEGNTALVLTKDDAQVHGLGKVVLSQGSGMHPYVEGDQINIF